MHFSSVEEQIIFDKLAASLVVETPVLPDAVCVERPDIDEQIKNCLWAMCGNEPLIQGTVRGYIDPTVGLGPPLLVYSEDSTWMGIKRGLSGVFVRPVRKLFAASIVSAKKLVLKFVRWYVKSIFDHQLEFNRSTVGAVDRLAQLVEEQRLSLAALQDECKNTGVRVDGLEPNINSLESSVGQLAEGHSNLEARYGHLAEGHNALEQRQDQLNLVQRIGSGQITALQEAMGRLNDLGIDIYAKPEVNEQKTFSQAGEDVIVSWLLFNLHIPLNEVVYLDLGANHAKTLSNTYHFYLNGAKGVLVEANPDLIPELKFYRHRDVILNCCVAEHSDDLVEFHIFACGDGLSTTDRDRAGCCLANNTDLQLKESVFVKSITIEDLIEKHLGRTPVILNIDIEGDELKILKTINFTKYRPLIIIIEMIPYRVAPINSPKDEGILSFMKTNGYVECAFTGINSIFLDGGRIKREGTA